MASGQNERSFSSSVKSGSMAGMPKHRSAGTLTEEEASNLRQNLRRFRQEFSDAIGREFTSDDAAELAQMSVDTYRGYEVGARNPRLGAIAKLATLFERPIEDFISASPPPRPPHWRPGVRYAFKAVALDADLEAEAIAAIEAVKRKQLERAMAEKAKMRKKKP